MPPPLHVIPKKVFPASVINYIYMQVDGGTTVSGKPTDGWNNCHALNLTN